MKARALNHCFLVALLLQVVCANAEPAGDFLFTVDNDLYGLGPVDEWDDLATGGFTASAVLSGNFEVTTSYDVLTWRSSSPETASRIDAIGILFAYRFLDYRAGAWRAQSSVGIGAVGYGNFGGLFLQEDLHEGIDVHRPVPTRHDACQSGCLAASLEGEIVWDGWLARPALFYSLEGEIPDIALAEAGARAALGCPGSMLSAWILARYMAAPPSCPTLTAVARQTSGVVSGIWCEASYLTSSWEYNLEHGISNGSIGIRIPNAAHEETEESLPISLEVLSDISSLSPGRRMFTPIFGSAVRAFFGTGMGWWSADHGSTRGVRYAEYSAGLEGRLEAPCGRLGGQVACGLGPILTVLSEQTLETERSRVLDRSVRIGCRIEPALRIGVVEHLPGGWWRVTGIGISVAIDAFAWHFVPFAGSEVAPDRTFHIRIFAFGENSKE